MLKRLKLAMAVTSMMVGAALALPALAQAPAKPKPPAPPARYSVKKVGDIVQLRDSRTDSTVSVLTGTSNAYEFVVHGKNVISMNIPSTTALRNNPGLNGVPFLGPFANRMDEMAFYANGKKYNFDPELGNVRNLPSQGFLSGTHDWKTVTFRADANSAYIVSKLDFYRNPDWMKQFPFAQTYTMTIRLQNGVLEVNTKIDNLSNVPLPVAIGYHPYFALPEGDRNKWSLDFGAKTHWIETPARLPTGETQAAEKFFGVADRHNIQLSNFVGKGFDDVFADLDRDAQGRASVVIKGEKTSIKVTAGPKIKTFLLYSQAFPAAPPAPPAPGAPPRPAQQPQTPPPVYPYDGPVVPLTAPNDVPRATRGFIAIEPMVGITNAINLAHKGVYKELQTIAPGGSWNESIWIAPTGF